MPMEDAFALMRATSNKAYARSSDADDTDELDKLVLDSFLALKYPTPKVVVSSSTRH